MANNNPGLVIADVTRERASLTSESTLLVSVPQHADRARSQCLLVFGASICSHTHSATRFASSLITQDCADLSPASAEAAEKCHTCLRLPTCSTRRPLRRPAFLCQTASTWLRRNALRSNPMRRPQASTSTSTSVSFATSVPSSFSHPFSSTWCSMSSSASNSSATALSSLSTSVMSTSTS